MRFVADYPDDPFGGLNVLLGQTTMKVKGSRILDENADEVKGGTAIWRNPSGTLDVTLMPAMPPSQIILLVGGGVAVLLGVGGGGFLLLRMRGPRLPRPPRRRNIRSLPLRPKRPVRPRPFGFLYKLVSIVIRFRTRCIVSSN